MTKGQDTEQTSQATNHLSDTVPCTLISVRSLGSDAEVRNCKDWSTVDEVDAVYSTAPWRTKRSLSGMDNTQKISVYYVLFVLN